MSDWRKTFFAITVAFLMLATVIPLQDAGGVRADTVPADREVPDDGTAVEILENDDGTFSMSLPFLEERFGIGAGHPDPGDPTYGTLGRIVPEIHSYFGDNSRNTIIEPDGSYLADGRTVTNGVARGVQFAAGFSYTYLETGVEDVFTYGITSGGEWFIQNTTNTDAHRKTAGDSQYLGRLLTEYGNVNQYQGSNLLPYAVGNFIEDSTEEFALYMGDRIDIYDCVDTENDYMWPTVSIPLPDNSYNGYGYSVNPVSMAAGDTDGDGLDEIAVTVEYSEDHGSDYGCANGAHRTFLYLLNHGDSQVRSSQLYMDFRNDHYGVTEHLDTVMTSVQTVDYDFDTRDEILVGGYMWDNGNHSEDVCRDPNYFTGELYVCSVDPDTVGTDAFEMMSLSRLMDDCDSSTAGESYRETEYDRHATNGPLTDGRDYKDHNEKDTSIMLEDWSDNFYGYCRSPNWTNWTVPMQAMLFRSAAETPYLYFDNCIYMIDNRGILTHYTDIPLEHGQDNNNCQCINVEAGPLIVREDLQSMYFDDLYRFVCMDRLEDDGADLHFTHELTYMDVGEIDVVGDESVESVTLDTHVRSWEGVYEPCTGCLVEYDPTDRIDVEFCGALSSFRDPTVIAAISGIPYDSDLEACLLNGAGNIGRTAYTNTESSSTEVSKTFDIQIDMCGGLDTFVAKMSGQAGFNYRYGWTNVHTTTVSTEFSSSDDAVALYFQPYDSYSYIVTEYASGTPEKHEEILVRWYEPMQLTLTYDDYVDVMTQYNDSMCDFFESRGKTFEKLDILKPFKHTRGDISSYYEDYDPDDKDSLTQVGVSYTGGKGSSKATVRVELSDTEKCSDMFGANVGINTMAGVGLKAGVDVKSSSGETTTHTDMTGTGFLTEMASGLTAFYDWCHDGDPNADAEALSVTSQYGMTGTSWARSMSVNGSPYVYMGYTVTEHASACKNGWIAPDYCDLDDPDDRDDPRNPDSESFYLQVMVPGDVRVDLLGERYVLQMWHGNEWYDWNEVSSALGIQFAVEATDGDGGTVLVPMEDAFAVTPGKDQLFWVNVTGFGDHPLDDYYFRLMGYDGDGNPHPSHEAVAGLFYSSLSDSIGHVDGFDVRGNTVFLPRLDDMGGKTFVMLSTDLAPGSVIDIRYDDGNGGYTDGGRSVVSSEGCILLRIPQEDTGGSVPLPVALLVFGGILVCLGAGAYVLRRP